MKKYRNIHAIKSSQFSIAFSLRVIIIHPSSSLSDSQRTTVYT